jgi:hypothetical protein
MIDSAVVERVSRAVLIFVSFTGGHFSDGVEDWRLSFPDAGE